MRGLFRPPLLGRRLASGTRTSCSASSLVSEASSESLPFWSLAVNPSRSVSTMKPRIDFVVVDLARLRPDDRDVGHRAVRDPHLGAVEHPVVAVLYGTGEHPARVRAEVGLREAEASDELATGQLGQPLEALLLGAELEDRVHDECTLHGAERPDPGVAALELLHDEPIGNVVQARAPVLFGQVGSVEAELRHLRDQLMWKGVLDVVVLDDRDQLALDPITHHVPHGSLLVAEEVVHLIVIDAFEAHLFSLRSKGPQSVRYARIATTTITAEKTPPAREATHP